MLSSLCSSVRLCMSLPAGGNISQHNDDTVSKKRAKWRCQEGFFFLRLSEVSVQIKFSKTVSPYVVLMASTYYIQIGDKVIKISQNDYMTGGQSVEKSTSFFIPPGKTTFRIQRCINQTRMLVMM